MVTKGFKQMMAEANAVIETISMMGAMAAHEQGESIFVDVRESQEWAAGHIPGSVSVPRGFLEFIADPEGPMHLADLSSGRRLMVYCGTGGRSTLAAKTFHDMGITNIANVAGGFQAWVAAGCEVEQ